MTRNFVTFLAITACILIAALDDNGLSTSLFDNPSGAQIKGDFVSAPGTMETPFGTLKFTGGRFPTPETAEKLYDEMDLQYAPQAF